MLCKVIACLLITYRLELVQCKAWPDQSGRYDYSDQSHGWGNPYYNRANYGQGEFGSEPTTTSTTKPLYPTLYPRYQPSAPAPAHIPPNGRPFEDDSQRQVPVNPFEVIPLQPNVGGNRNSNHSHSNRNDYSDNNFNYPFDNTRATYPPFDGSTKRPTFPTRRAFSNFPSASRIENNTSPHSVNPTHPTHPTHPTNPTNPHYGPYNNNHHNYDSRNDRNNSSANSGSLNQNFNNSGASAFRPFPSADQLNQQGQNGNPYQNQPSYQPSKGAINPHQNQPNNQNNGNPYQSQPNYQPTKDPTNSFQNHPTNQFNNGNPYQNPSNYQSNIGRPNQGTHDKNMNTVLTNQNSFNQPQANRNPDYDPNGIALAPFPDVSSMTNNYNDGRQYFNQDNVHHRQPPSNIQPEVNSRFNSNGPSQVPLAGYTGAHVPLA